MQMSPKAMEKYVQSYFNEVETALLEGSISSIDPRLVPMFMPEGNESYAPEQTK